MLVLMLKQYITKQDKWYLTLHGLKGKGRSVWLILLLWSTASWGVWWVSSSLFLFAPSPSEVRFKLNCIILLSSSTDTLIYYRFCRTRGWKLIHPNSATYQCLNDSTDKCTSSHLDTTWVTDFSWIVMNTHFWALIQLIRDLNQMF